MSRPLTPIAVVVTCLVVAAGCRPQPEVVVYASLDQEFSEPIFQQFEAETGIKVRALFDTEANKTAGLTNRILISERNRPRCDLFWNNEIINTIRLQNAGLLATAHPADRAQFPDEFCDRQDEWFGLAARARVLLLNTERFPAEGEATRPNSLHDLIDPKWRDQVGMAKPLFGTTATHAACLRTLWGEAEFKTFYQQLQKNVRIFPGNKQVAQAVSSGQIAFGITDTDDAIIELEQGRPVEIIFPDQAADQMGTLFVPNSLAIIRNGPNPAEAELLLDYLLSARIESALAQGPSAQIPLAQGVTTRSRVEPAVAATQADSKNWIGGIKVMDVDFRMAANHWDEVAKFLTQTFASN